MKNRYIGDRAFYGRVCRIAMPIIIQNGITNFVSLLDNIMVGQVGTLPMSGVSIVNQLLFVFNLCIFGASAGAGIFTAQFYGKEDHQGVRYTFRFKFLICLAVAAIGGGVLLLWGKDLIGLYLSGEGAAEDAAAALGYGWNYLLVMLLGLVPFAISNAYTSTLRECGETFVPMMAGIGAVFVNLLLNYVLIFGHFGFPAMGVAGAATATVISRFVELFAVMAWSHTHKAAQPFICGAYRSFHVPRQLLGAITVRGLPLLINELLWSVGMAFMNQCYSTCSLEVVPAMNISTTLFNLASVSFLAMGNSVGIIMGQMLGSRTPREEVLDSNRKLIFVCAVSGVIFGLAMVCVRDIFPLLYNTDAAVRQLASQLILISSCMLVVHSYVNACYFTLRSGGQTMITFVFDSGFVWCVTAPLAFCLSRFTGLSIIPLYALCQLPDIAKCIVGRWLVKKGVWIQNLT